MNDYDRDAYAVLLPAFAGLALSEDVCRYLDRGGVSVLLGETRDEYVGRAMSAQRRTEETATHFRDIVESARRRAGAGVLVAVDQELGGIRRLHDLVPALPSLEEALRAGTDTIEERSAAVAAAARELGINLFLSPIADVVTGANPWLDGRHLGAAADVLRIARAFVQGVQSAGVAATAKHFPGHPVTALDPALAEAVVGGGLADLAPTLDVFRALIASGVKAVMAGPALVPAIDVAHPSSTSRDTLSMLRHEFAFHGLIISDDLDAPGILRGRSIEATAVAALDAGADLLLVSSEAGLDRIAGTIVEAVRSGALDSSRLAQAANRVRALARELDCVQATGRNESE
ncbi:glycoside hydrolase family 3 N-terminal domain-containing protein [Burkholderia cenocepacia]|uniref:Glycoside hydrolase n=1 Tax=Burkholderia cenocepacia TaxID=95486 RepID=A0A1V2W1Y1_9BURK|nr:glycoside hydrolase family 3 N-terminal domain-containing protein [Burkholderia cenocepacia]MBR8250241.1 glycoside hydrolase family 3 protein [Burkholderia cenocepacia]MBR8286552.1 glycoside hydrolase family 3 protein [Burkholderia cenocepacia]ONI99819.1 glycoside hydrolase [Burkholderia cenocepacia]ONJ22399.1 glycoside hydrolase [Burkholderia cenocepacia]ONP21276.1 glycoside hydrolase [Burkholderia cenocepacia]